jgi:hypothetical protein
MIKYYQNRELSEKLTINLAKWKRWSREFLPPDPLGGLQSGYPRQYNPDDAFTVYLGGYLVTGLKFSIPEAKQILSDLNAWMLANNFYYYFNHINGKNPDADQPAGDYRIYISPDKAAADGSLRFCYHIKLLLAYERMPSDSPNTIREHYLEEVIDSPGETSPIASPVFAQSVKGSRVVYLTVIYKKFMELLGIAVDRTGEGERKIAPLLSAERPV